MNIEKKNKQRILEISLGLILFVQLYSKDVLVPRQHKIVQNYSGFFLMIFPLISFFRFQVFMLH